MKMSCINYFDIVGNMLNEVKKAEREDISAAWAMWMF